MRRKNDFPQGKPAWKPETIKVLRRTNNTGSFKHRVASVPKSAPELSEGKTLAKAGDSGSNPDPVANFRGYGQTREQRAQFLRETNPTHPESAPFAQSYLPIAEIEKLRALTFDPPWKPYPCCRSGKFVKLDSNNNIIGFQ